MAEQDKTTAAQSGAARSDAPSGARPTPPGGQPNPDPAKEREPVETVTQPNVVMVDHDKFGKRVSLPVEEVAPKGDRPSVQDIPVGSENPIPDKREQATAVLPDGGLANRPGMSHH